MGRGQRFAPEGAVCGLGGDVCRVHGLEVVEDLGDVFAGSRGVRAGAVVQLAAKVARVGGDGRVADPDGGDVEGAEGADDVLHDDVAVVIGY